MFYFYCVDTNLLIFLSSWQNFQIFILLYVKNTRLRVSNSQCVSVRVTHYGQQFLASRSFTCQCVPLNYGTLYLAPLQPSPINHLHSFVLWCTLFCSVILCCTIYYYAALCCIFMHTAGKSFTLLHSAALCCTQLHSALLCCIMSSLLHTAGQSFTLMYSVVLSLTLLYYAA